MSIDGGYGGMCAFCREYERLQYGFEEDNMAQRALIFPSVNMGYGFRVR